MRQRRAGHISKECHTGGSQGRSTDILLELVGNLLKRLVKRIVGLRLGLRTVSGWIPAPAFQIGDRKVGNDGNVQGRDI